MVGMDWFALDMITPNTIASGNRRQRGLGIRPSGMTLPRNLRAEVPSRALDRLLDGCQAPIAPGLPNMRSTSWRGRYRLYTIALLLLRAHPWLWWGESVTVYTVLGFGNPRVPITSIH